MTPAWRFGTVLLLAGCSGANAGQSGPQPCAPVTKPESEVSAAGLGGRYDVRMVATSGAKRGESTGGQLELMAREGAGPRAESEHGSGQSTTTFPWYGTAQLDFGAVGAVVPGDPSASNPEAPGVLVLERPGRVMLRVGSEANRSDLRRFDGAYTVLQVQQVTDSGFAGTWRSGVGTEQSSGHFCAQRT